MVELTDREAHQIIEAVQKVQQKHMTGGDVTGEKLGRLATELEGRLNDIGYDVTVDVTPMLAGQPPTVRINRKLDKPDYLEFEEKKFEIKKRQEKGEKAPEIEGHV